MKSAQQHTSLFINLNHIKRNHYLAETIYNNLTKDSQKVFCFEQVRLTLKLIGK